ncbi:aspartate-semialdehyde dehydrogenase [bacterium TMED181]|nr:aspartate-semialdehyde dehydrogenase [Planctomycetota bacterium]OUW41792.1 MAG: aspartate-semialdehyde dehydrogenase [bacterium TMED181]
MRTAIVGATGVVGQEMLSLLEDSPLGEEAPRLVASPRSAGKEFSFRDQSLVVEALDSDLDLTGVDIALFAAGGSISREWAPRFVDQGVAVVDNSSAFRLDPSVPLVIPEVNGETIPRGPAIIANPNCSTIILLMALKPIWHLGPDRLVVDTYQAVSGAGLAGLDALERESAGGEFIQGDPFPFPIHGNLFPAIGETDGEGVTVEERKMLDECRKILGAPELVVQGTCVRVPVARCHSLAATLIFGDHDHARLDQAKEALKEAEGVIFHDDAENPPTPGPLSGAHPVSVGRLRAPFADTLQMWIVGDQVLKGAALNTVQIAERWSFPS